jgi:maltokinase
MNESEVIAQVAPLLVKWLPEQRWFSGSEGPPMSVDVFDHEILVAGAATLLWMLVRVDGKSVYQVPIGIGLEAAVGSATYGQDAFVLGRINIDGAEQVVYDGLIDASLTRPLLTLITKGEITPKSVRPMGAEQSNTSLVFDSRYVAKFIRRLYEGNNPDLEVTQALTDAEFPNIAPVIATWQRDSYDLAVCQPYLWDGTDGWKLALASARDFLSPDTQGSSSSDGGTSVQLDLTNPAEAGGDFAGEAERLGRATAELHLAMAKAFPTERLVVDGLVASLESSVSVLPERQQGALQELIDEVRALPAESCGLAIRVHGDYHLGQTLRSVNGWFIFDFEGEPARPLAERTKPASPFKDVSGMLRSFHYAAASALFEQMENEHEALAEPAEAWETRNREAFLAGYFSTDGIGALLPPTGDGARETLMRALEVEKAIYELAYERSHRPTWVRIPESALERLFRS